jgi:hypothetical protein
MDPRDRLRQAVVHADASGRRGFLLLGMDRSSAPAAAALRLQRRRSWRSSSSLASVPPLRCARGVRRRARARADFRYSCSAPSAGFAPIGVIRYCKGSPVWREDVGAAPAVAHRGPRRQSIPLVLTGRRRSAPRGLDGSPCQGGEHTAHARHTTLIAPLSPPAGTDAQRPGALKKGRAPPPPARTQPSPSRRPTQR